MKPEEEIENLEQAKEEFAIWLQDRPDVIKELAEKLPPWFDYKIKATDKVCRLVSYSEDGTVTVWTLDMFGIPYNVFGYTPEDLERVVL